MPGQLKPQLFISEGDDICHIVGGFSAVSRCKYSDWSDCGITDSGLAYPPSLS